MVHKDIKRSEGEAVRSYDIALQFYVSNTDADSINEYIVHAVRKWINMEAEEPKDSRDFISQELKLILQ